MVLRRSLHTQHVLLEGTPPSDGTPRFRIVQNDPTRALAQRTALSRLRDLLAPEPLLPKRGVTWGRFRAALIAVDGDAEGLTYRDIAIRINGPDEVERSWNDLDRILKNRTIRAVQRGRRFVAGGYRNLLKAPGSGQGP